jgi:hypothetical protein
MTHKDPEARKAYAKAWNEANKERRADNDKAYVAAHRDERRAYEAAYYEKHKDEIRANNMVNRPWMFRKAYDPNCRPFPATYDPVVGGWVRCERTLLPAPDTSLAVRVAAAITMIEEELAS